jgi:hypothetical protein
MRTKFLLLGGAGGFVLLLILGVIFAIRAGFQNQDTAAASATPGGQSAVVSSAGVVAPSDSDPTSLGYTILASVEPGQTIFAKKSDATTPQAAILAALRDMSRVLDSKPTVLGAFADAQEHKRGGATFSGSLHSRAVQGTIFCGIGEKGAAVSIIYDASDAPAADWNKLAAALPGDTQMKEQSFGDGVGTISIPPDWKIVSASNIGSVSLAGPAGQSISLGAGFEVVTPNSMGAAVQNQLAASGQLTPATRMLVAPFTGPQDALKNLSPQLSDMSQSRGGPGIDLDEIMQSTPVQAELPGGQAARINFRTTHSLNGQALHYRAWGQIECYPIGNGTWGLFASVITGPDRSFDVDLPLMIEISQSWKLDNAVLGQHTQQDVAASNARFCAFEHSMQEKEDAFDGYLKSIQHDELIQDRSNADFDEVIRGYRTVYDTASGEKTSVDLGSVNGIVNALNEGDPGRYVQIPLRDEEFPLAGVEDDRVTR